MSWLRGITRRSVPTLFGVALAVAFGWCEEVTSLVAAQESGEVEQLAGDAEQVSDVEGDQEAEPEGRSWDSLMGALGRAFGWDEFAEVFSDEYGYYDGPDAAFEIIGEPAPDFAEPGLRGGLIKLADFRGKPLVLVVWPQWDYTEFPVRQTIAEIAKNTSGDDVGFLGIATGEYEDGVRDVVNEEDLDLRHIYDYRGRLAADYRVADETRVILIDADGVVQASLRGFDEMSDPEATLKSQIERLRRGEQLFDEAETRREKAVLAARRDAVNAALREVAPERLVQTQIVVAGEDAPWIDVTYSERTMATLEAGEPAVLAMGGGESDVLLIRGGEEPVETINFDLPDDLQAWDFAPLFFDDAAHWATTGEAAYYDGDETVVFVALFGRHGEPVWRDELRIPSLYLSNSEDVVCGDLDGDGRKEIVVLYSFNELASYFLTGPDGTTRVICVYSDDGELLHRSWAPRHDSSGVQIIPGRDRDYVMLSTEEGLASFRFD